MRAPDEPAIEFLVLQVLGHEPIDQATIEQRVLQRMRGRIQLTDASVSAALHRLHSKVWIAQTADGISLTPSGEQELQARLTNDVADFTTQMDHSFGRFLKRTK